MKSTAKRIGGTGPDWLQDAVFYQVYPQSFCDSNGDGVGDLRGITSKLPYLRDLGVTALWLNPIFESPFRDAGYDISDFRRIAPRYGTISDLRELCREAHRLGLRVVLDLVAGHTSDEHPWFKASAQPVPNRYTNRYLWVEADDFTRHDYPTIKGYSDRPAYYIPNYYYFQPALNYGFENPDPQHSWQRSTRHPDCRATREELRSIMRFWLDQGVDGFRVDMAFSLVRNDPNRTGARALWGWFRRWLKREYPGAVMISEWSNPKAALGAGFHVDLMLHFGVQAFNYLFRPWPRFFDGRTVPPPFFGKAGQGDINLFLEPYLQHFRATQHTGFIALPSGCHDFPRPSNGREPAELRVVFAMLLTMPGIPFIYYGDEIGLKYQAKLTSKEGGYQRTGSRTPMQWERGRNLGFSKAPARKLYLPVEDSRNPITVAAQENDPGSLLNLVRRLIQLRRNIPALGNAGGFAVVHAKAGAPFVYERKAGSVRYCIAINPAGRPCTLALPPYQQTEIVLAEGASLKNGQLSLNPISFGIFRVKKPAVRRAR